jgi:hypothetical protein
LPPELENENGSTDKGQNREDNIVPDQQWILGKRYQCLSDSSGDRVGWMRERILRGALE